MNVKAIFELGGDKINIFVSVFDAVGVDDEQAQNSVDYRVEFERVLCVCNVCPFQCAVDHILIFVFIGQLRFGLMESE